jgi:hypothetical protein
LISDEEILTPKSVQGNSPLTLPHKISKIGFHDMDDFILVGES